MTATAALQLSKWSCAIKYVKCVCLDQEEGGQGTTFAGRATKKFMMPADDAIFHVRIPKRNRKQFFFEGPGKRIRTSAREHVPIQRDKKMTCVMCHVWSPAKQCSTCKVPLCTRTPKAGLRSSAMSCFDEFHKHSASEDRPRQPAVTGSSPNMNGAPGTSSDGSVKQPRVRSIAASTVTSNVPCRIPKRNRKHYFLEGPGKQTRLSENPHERIPLEKKMTCVMCGVWSPSNQCSTCKVPLCTRTPKSGLRGVRKSCFDMFHAQGATNASTDVDGTTAKADVRIPKRNRKQFFLVGAGKSIRLQNGAHKAAPLPKKMTCVMCGTWSPANKCSICQVPLCTRKPKSGQGTDAVSCFDKFHKYNAGKAV